MNNQNDPNQPDTSAPEPMDNQVVQPSTQNPTPDTPPNQTVQPTTPQNSTQTPSQSDGSSPAGDFSVQYNPEDGTFTYAAKTAPVTPPSNESSPTIPVNPTVPTTEATTPQPLPNTPDEETQESAASTSEPVIQPETITPPSSQAPQIIEPQPEQASDSPTPTTDNANIENTPPALDADAPSPTNTLGSNIITPTPKAEPQTPDPQQDASLTSNTDGFQPPQINNFTRQRITSNLPNPANNAAPDTQSTNNPPADPLLDTGAQNLDPQTSPTQASSPPPAPKQAPEATPQPLESTLEPKTEPIETTETKSPQISSSSLATSESNPLLSQLPDQPTTSPTNPQPSEPATTTEPPQERKTVTPPKKDEYNTFQLPTNEQAGVQTPPAPTQAPATEPKAQTDINLKDVAKAKTKTAIDKIRSINYKPLVSAAVIGILVFGVFNSQVILGQVQYLTTPSGGLDAPNIVDTDAQVGSEPRIIIPQINVDVPVVYDEPSFEEEKVQRALERGVVHYGTTAMPGEKGNTVIVGHSSNNWWDSGEFKFAFILLDKLNNGDQIVLHYEGTRYVYEVERKVVVEPTDISVIRPTDEPILTLITCTPPGTSWQRLVVQAKQVTPDPNENTEPTHTLTEPVEVLPSDSVSNFFDFLRNLF